MNVKGIGQIVASEGVDGPGVRAVVHFAGCTVGCAGCFNPHTHSSTGDGTWERDACDLAEDLLAVSPAVTISGGEPKRTGKIEQPSPPETTRSRPSSTTRP